MSRADHIQLMANYNEWMNTKLFDAAMRLSDEQIARDNKAFFGSILGTLNHLVVTDTIWLKRIATHPANYPQLKLLQNHATPTSLDQILFNDIRSLWSHRKLMDAIILKWVKEIDEPDLDELLHYKNMKGVASKRNFYSIIMHLFNHQTHHRGQATTLLSQNGIDVGVTDLLMIIPDQILN